MLISYNVGGGSVGNDSQFFYGKKFDSNYIFEKKNSVTHLMLILYFNLKLKQE